MGSAVSVVIADLVMEHVEVQALSTFTASSRWWFRHVDDSNACIKSTELDNFHRQLNAVNPHIQFTVERATPMDGKPTIAFLDTNVSILPNGDVEVQVYRKATHTNKYLAFDSHHPAQHKRSVGSTLMRRANTIPSSEALRTEETSHVQDSLQVNGYPTKFIENAAQPMSGPQSHHPDPAGLAMVPYVQGVSDKVKRTLQHFNIKTAFKPIRTLASVFKKPKDRLSEEKIAGIVYRIFPTLVRANGAGLRGEWSMIPRVLQVKSRQSDNMPKEPRTTSNHATAKFLKGMKLITSAEFFWGLYTQTLIRTL